ncbi:unnamed protein product [Mesocestoides corti]|uniref:DAG1 domain-containing protein n=1 Tax=Mesocestoides corti TaxID=53468 RepID=A0A0R3UDZ6_MESCO|nr:unnamed protein product [Mesocestoides corti]
MEQSILHKSFDSSLAWFLAFIVVAIILLLVLLTVICILAYLVYRLRQKVASVPPDDGIIYGYSNKHAELMEYRSSQEISNASLMDPWNTGSKYIVPCDCQCQHADVSELRKSNFSGCGVQFHTYPKVGFPRKGDRWLRRVLSQPVSFRFLQRPLPLLAESRGKVDIPKNRRVERLLQEATQQGEVNLTWPREPS